MPLTPSLLSNIANRDSASASASATQQLGKVICLSPPHSPKNFLPLPPHCPQFPILIPSSLHCAYKAKARETQHGSFTFSFSGKTRASSCIHHLLGFDTRLSPFARPQEEATSRPRPFSKLAVVALLSRPPSFTLVSPHSLPLFVSRKLR